MTMVKRVLRGIVKTIALLAGLVFFFDNRVTGTAGTVLLGSIISMLPLSFRVGDFS